MQTDITILDYKCHKALTSFRGRDYVAWFTLDIPISNGPWKFGGLPGLILQVSDSKKHYVWEIIGIKDMDKKSYIKEYNYKYSKEDRLKLMKVERRYYADFASFLTNKGIEVIKMEDDGTSKTVTTSTARPYNPIELE